MAAKRDCPVCGEEMDDEYPYEICDNCGWVHDWFQEEYPDEEGQENEMSFNQAKEAYKKGLKVY